MNQVKVDFSRIEVKIKGVLLALSSPSQGTLEPSVDLLGHQDTWNHPQSRVHEVLIGVCGGNWRMDFSANRVCKELSQSTKSSLELGRRMFCGRRAHMHGSVKAEAEFLPPNKLVLKSIKSIAFIQFQGTCDAKKLRTTQVKCYHHFVNLPLK